MSEVPYSDFAYKREKKRGKFSFFVLVVIVFAGIVGFMLYGVFTSSGIGGNKSKVVAESITVWAVEIDTFTGKSAAYSCSDSAKTSGSAGYLVSSSNWSVLDCVYSSREEADSVCVSLITENAPSARVKQYSVDAREIKVTDKKHTAILNKIVSSFGNNFEMLEKHLKDFIEGTANTAEIASRVLAQYHELQSLLVEFDKIQENAQSLVYAKTILHANKQLLALYLLSTESGAGSRFESAVKTAICSIIFSYFEMVESFA